MARGIVVRVVARGLRRHRLRVRLGLARSRPPEIDTALSPSATPDVVAELRGVHAVPEDQPVQERVALVLKRVEGMTQEPIAQALGTNVPTARVRLGAHVVPIAAVLAAAVALVVVWWPWREPTWTGGSVMSDREPQTVLLSNGCRVEMERETRMDPCMVGAEGPCVALAQGRARFTVPYKERPGFVVRVGEVEVRVLGTRFAVARNVEGNRTTVSVVVEQGVVEVRVAGGAPRVLHTAESWSGTAQSAPGELSSRPGAAVSIGTSKPVVVGDTTERQGEPGGGGGAPEPGSSTGAPGRSADCSRAKATCLDRYASGAHVREVDALCQ